MSTGSARGAAEVTVVLPVRNGAATLQRAVRSTLRALPASGRLLVHDDASTDGTAEVLSSCADPRLTVLTSEEPQGVAGGLNLLLQHVQSPLVARMDADDVTLPWRFRAQTAAVAGGADAVWSTVVGFGDVPGSLRPGPPLRIDAEAMPLHLLLSNPVAHSTLLARTDVLVQAGGYRPVPAEDYELWMRVAEAGNRCVRLALPTLMYRFHADQVTAAAGWAERSWSDPTQRASYARLSRRALGLEPTWYDDLVAPEPVSESARARLSTFAAAVESAATSLPRGQRMFLLRKVKQVVARAS